MLKPFFAGYCVELMHFKRKRNHFCQNRVFGIQDAFFKLLHT